MAVANDVPEGTVSDVLAWVGEDPGRAQAALDHERQDQGRSTLITRLEAIASEEQENPDVTEPLATEDEQAPAPEQPAEVNIDSSAEGTVVGPIHVRDGGVEVPPDADLTPQPGRDGETRAIPAQQVEFFQAVSATNGVVLALNGTAFVFNPELAATLKGALDKMVAGLSF
jgi:hypothetical protein